MKKKDYKSFGKIISQISRLGKTFISGRLSVYGIGFGQFQILHALYRLNNPTQEEISQAIGVHKGATARTIVKLLDEGYLRRRVDPENRRAYRLELTNKGAQIEDEINMVLRQWTARLTKGFTAQEKAQALGFLERMAANVLNGDTADRHTDEQK